MLIVSSVAYANVLMKITFGAPVNSFSLSLAAMVSRAMQQLTIKMTLRHNFHFHILRVVERLNNMNICTYKRNNIMNEKNINQLMTISKERINLNLLTPNRRQRRIMNM